MAENDELIAVIGHEVGHILSNRTQDFTIISYCTFGLKIASYFFFILLLLLINPVFATAWIGFVAAFSVRTLRGSRGFDKDFQKILGSILTIFNPPYVLTNFLVVTLFYFSTRDEEFYADIMSVQLNRNTAGLYSILQKLKDYEEPRQPLPQQLSMLYFTKEIALPDSLTLQPDIDERLNVLKSIDSLVAKIKPQKIQKNIKCPYCKSEMVEYSVPTYYGTFVNIDRCPRCLSTWFDNTELWVVADLTLLVPQDVYLEAKHQQKEYFCPKCGVELQKNLHSHIPNYYHVYKCPVCQGNFMHPKDTLGFGMHRKKWLADKNNNHFR